MSLEKFITIRMSEDLYKKLKALKITTTELRKVIMEYVEKRLGEPPKTQDVSTQDVSPASEMLEKFKSKAKEYINTLHEFCRDHARTHANEHGNEDFIYDLCRYELRRHAYNTLRDYYYKEIKPLIPREYLNTAEREAFKIINNAVKELYGEPYPPVRPP